MEYFSQSIHFSHNIFVRHIKLNKVYLKTRSVNCNLQIVVFELIIKSEQVHLTLTQGWKSIYQKHLIPHDQCHLKHTTTE